MGFDVSVPKESAIVSGKDSQKEKSNSPKTQKTENSSRYGKDRNTERVNLQRVRYRLMRIVFMEETVMAKSQKLLIFRMK